MWLLTPIGFFSIVQKPDDTTRNTPDRACAGTADLESLRLRYLPGLEKSARVAAMTTGPPRAGAAQ